MSHQQGIPPSDHAGSELDYMQLLQGVLRRRKKAVIAAFALIGLPLLWWTMFGGRPRFESSAVAHIKSSIADLFPGAKDLPGGPDLSVQMAVLKSRRLAQEVIEVLPEEALNEVIKEQMQPHYFFLAVSTLRGLVRPLLGKPPVVITSHEQAMSAMSEIQDYRMKFQALNREDDRGPSGLVKISAVAFRPQVAMDLVNAYVQVLVKWSRRSEQEDVAAAREFLELQLNRVQRELKESEGALGNFENRFGVVKLTERTQFEMSRLVQLQGDLARVQASQEVARRRLSALEKALQKSPANPVVSDSQITAEAGQSINARLLELESSLVQMRAKYTEQHPALIATRAEIQTLRGQLARLPVGEIQEGAPMSHSATLRAIATVKANLAELGGQERPLQLQVDELRQSLQKLSGRESEYSQLSGSVGTNRALLSVLSDRLFALRSREEGTGGVVKVIDPPHFPMWPIGGVTQRNLAFLLFLALGGAMGLGFLIEYINEPIESEQTVRRQISLPFLGMALALPSPRPNGPNGKSANDRPLVVVHPSRKAAMPQEFYRTIRTNVEATNLRSPHACKTIMITSACPGEGKSTTAVNLAITLRELGRRVALVDADLRRPSLSKVFSSGVLGGLTNLLDETRYAGNSAPSLEIALEAMAARSQPDFLFIPSGGPAEDPAALLGSARAGTLVALLKTRFDYVLFDSPPMLLVTDNLLFATSLDGVILIARAGQTRRRDLERTKTLLEEAGARILGVILNQVPASQIPYYYHRYWSSYAPPATPDGNNKSGQQARQTVEAKK